MAEKVARKFEEGAVLFANAIEDADGFVASAGEANDLATGTAEFSLKRDNARGRLMKMLFEEAL